MNLFSAWNTYAVSMMNVLENAGMWNKEDTFQKFMSVTGIASEFCVDQTCSALPITDYDWITEHTCYMERIGVKTTKYYCSPGNPMYSAIQQEAVQAVKNGIEQNHAAVAWGIDTGEFGIIYGFDDEDGVFFTKGIGSRDTNSSIPVLYSNLGKTFEPAPILYCEIPQSKQAVDWNQAYVNFLKQYVHNMNRSSDNHDRAYGLAGYDFIEYAIREQKLNEFGIRYCTGIFYERKDAILHYLLERQVEDSSDLLFQLIEAFRKTVKLYQTFMFDILEEKTNGWDYLFQPVNKECYDEMIETLHEMKLSETKNVNLAKQILESYSL